MQIIESFEDEGSRVTFHSKRNDNTIEVFHKMRVDGEKSTLPGSLSFSFEVEKVTDTKSLIIGKYQDENIHIEKLYYTYLARLGGVFSANFKESTTKRLAEIKAEIERESGVHWGWTKWRVDKRTGFRTRAYALIPNDPEPAQIGDAKASDTRQHGKSGRPNLPGDVWAWEQVNKHSRPMNEVYKEWIIRDDVKVRNLQAPKRQFNRITKPGWGIN